MKKLNYLLETFFKKPLRIYTRIFKRTVGSNYSTKVKEIISGKTKYKEAMIKI